MRGQGKVTRAIALENERCGWSIVYTCVPNTPHVNVVPITITKGSSRQRYPDIVAYKSQITKFVEVEISLSREVILDINTRFSEMVYTLSHDEIWHSWRTQIYKTTGHQLPQVFIPRCELVLCKNEVTEDKHLIDLLHSASIDIFLASNYHC